MMTARELFTRAVSAYGWAPAVFTRTGGGVASLVVSLDCHNPELDVLASDYRDDLEVNLLVSNFVGGREAGKPRYVYTVVFPGSWVEDLEAADGSAGR